MCYMDRGYNVTQVESTFYSKCKLIIAITVVAYIGLIIVPISAIVVCPFTTCINYKPMHVFNLLMYVDLRMYVGLCMCACMYVCMYVYIMYVLCMYVCMYVCMHVCIFVFIYVCMYGCRPMYVHVCTSVGLCMHVRTYV